jgi:CheY-like chemotaxis protein
MQSRSQEKSAPTVRPNTRLNALVIAERAVDRIVLGRFVALSGAAVSETDPAGALAALSARALDLVLVDAGPTDRMHLSLLDGPALPNHPAIFVIASSPEVARQMNGDPRIDAAICKPVTTDKIVPAIRDLLDGRRPV